MSPRETFAVPHGMTASISDGGEVTALLPSLPSGAVPRSSRDGPDRTRRACSEEASSVARGGPPAAACCARTYVRMRGVGWWWISPLPGASCAMRARRAEEGTRAEGRNGAPRRRAHRLAHVPLLPRAMCADDGPWRTRALQQQPPPRPAISADPVGRRAPPVWSDRPKIPVTFVAKHLRSASVRAWTRPRTHKRKATKGSNSSPGHRE